MVVADVPRLELLREFLSEDGAIFISVNLRDEYYFLRIICDDVFDRKNYVGTLTWKSVTQPTNSGRAKFGLQIKTEPILCYRMNATENIFELEQADNKKIILIKGNLENADLKLQKNPMREILVALQ